MRAHLGAFIRAMASSEFRWGSTDCALVIADWWMANHGDDPAAQLRGRYATERECHALLARQGGLARIVSQLARSVGAHRSEGATEGDFGIIRHDGRHLGAIRSRAGRWVVKSEHGVIALKNPKVVAAWSV